MNQEAADVQDEKPAEPEDYEYYCENEEHLALLSVTLKLVATSANCYRG